MSADDASGLDLDDPGLVSVLDELPLWSAPFGLKLLETVKLKEGACVLDLGCGQGFPLTEIAQRLGNSARVFGIDPWKQAAGRSKLKIEKYDIRNAGVIVCTGEELPFEDGFFDLIVSNNGLNNVSSMERTLAECARTSRSGAQMVITVNLEDTMKEFYSVYRRLLDDLGMEKEALLLEDHIRSKRRPIEELTGLIERAGFDVRAVEEDMFSLEYLDGTAMFGHFLIRLAFAGPWKQILDREDVDNVFAELEERLNMSAEAGGSLRLSVPFATLDCWRR